MMYLLLLSVEINIKNNRDDYLLLNSNSQIFIFRIIFRINVDGRKFLVRARVSLLR